ncbi:MAG: hypothetical protein PHC34_07360 [Candidatus Gastranaerophilales bacterium]|nr:hypothetical protein [Candidatus Gastranaerophilales bacterium]
MESSTSKTSFKTLTKKHSELPLWVKQVIYLQLKDDFVNLSILDSLHLFNREDCLQLYIPKITYIGKKEIETKSKGLQLNVYKFLSGVLQNLSIIEITIENNWSLSECSSYFMTAVNAELLVTPESICVTGTALYLSGAIRIGEYFVKLGKVNIEQLGETLKAQKYIEETLQDKLKIGTILIDLGLATKTEIEGIVLLKEESKRKYIQNMLVLDDSGPSNENSILKYQEKISTLESENTKLKERIRKILNIK